jgi:hypothetical protein
MMKGPNPVCPWDKVPPEDTMFVLVTGANRYVVDRRVRFLSNSFLTYISPSPVVLASASAHASSTST